MTELDQYSEWDAAYVLGALSVAERAEYEAHLTVCERCRAGVSELAGLPGLLGQLSPGEAMAVDAGESFDVLGVAGSSADDRILSGVPALDPVAAQPPPASLMPRLPGADRDRRRWLAPAAAAAAALLIGGVGGYAASASRSGSPGEAPTSTLALSRSRLAFAPVRSSPMTAVVDIVPTGEGTELRVECQYAPAAAGATTSSAQSGATSPPMTGPPMTGPSSTGSSATGPSMTGPKATGPSATTDPRGEGGYTGVRYAIWVVGRDGREMEVKDWTARSGRVMHPSGVTSWPVAQIAAVEIRLADTDDPVMRARLG